MTLSLLPLLLVTQLSGVEQPLSPTASLASAESTPVLTRRASVRSDGLARSDEAIERFQGPHMSALGKARHEKRPVALYFWMDGSALCSQMYNETLQDPGVVSALKSPLCLGVDIASANGTKLVQRYGITTLPTMLFLSSEGEREEAVIGFIDGPSLVNELQRIAAGTGTVSDFRRQVAASPEDLQLQHDLAMKLRDVGDVASHDDIVASIRTKDPKGKTTVGARLLFWEVRAEALATGAPADVDLKPVYKVVRKLVPQPVQYEAWEWLSNFELGRALNKPYRAAAREAWKHANANQLEFGVRTTMNFWNMREELNARETRFLKDMSAIYLQLARDTLTVDGEPVKELEGEEESPTYMLARAISAASIAEFLGGKKSAAMELIEEAVGLNPENGEFTLLRSTYGQ